MKVTGLHVDWNQHSLLSWKKSVTDSLFEYINPLSAAPSILFPNHVGLYHILIFVNVHILYMRENLSYYLFVIVFVQFDKKCWINACVSSLIPE